MYKPHTDTNARRIDVEYVHSLLDCRDRGRQGVTYQVGIDACNNGWSSVVGVERGMKNGKSPNQLARNLLMEGIVWAACWKI